ADLEAHTGRELARLPDPREGPIGGQCGGGVAERAEGEVARRHAGAQAEGRSRAVEAAVRVGRQEFELRVRLQHAELPADPVGADARLAVWNPPQVPTEDATGGAEDFFGAGERDAPDEMRAPWLIAHRTLLLAPHV